MENMNYGTAVSCWSAMCGVEAVYVPGKAFNEMEARFNPIQILGMKAFYVRVRKKPPKRGVKATYFGGCLVLLVDLKCNLLDGVGRSIWGCCDIVAKNMQLFIEPLWKLIIVP